MPMLDPQSKLIDRLVHGRTGDRPRPVVFVLGCGVSCPTKTHPEGVPATRELIVLIRDRLSQDKPGSESAFDDHLRNCKGLVQYAEACGFFERHATKRRMKELIRGAVLMATNTDARERPVLIEGDSLACEDLEHDSSRWYLRPGLQSLARIVAGSPGNPRIFGDTILTSNFDPLIEVALRAEGIEPVTTSIGKDSSIGETHTRHPHVVHFHGHWYNSRMLNLSEVVRAERRKLHASLAMLMWGCDLCVIGSSGGEDAFLDALQNTLAADENKTEVHWCFLEDDEKTIEAHYGEVIGKLGTLEAASFYSGIDVDLFMPALEKALGNILIRREDLESARLTQKLAEVTREVKRERDSARELVNISTILEAIECSKTLVDTYQTSNVSALTTVIEMASKVPPGHLVVDSKVMVTTGSNVAALRRKLTVVQSLLFLCSGLLIAAIAAGFVLWRRGG